MNKETTYYWHKAVPKNKAVPKKYVSEESNSVTSFNITESNYVFLKTFISSEYYLGFQNQYTDFTISTISKSLIDSLISEYNLKVNNVDFYLLSAFIQYRYISTLKTVEVDLEIPLLLDFQNEKKDFNKLLNILEDYISGHGNHKIGSILFSKENKKMLPRGKKSSTISNNFVIRDLLRILSEQYGLTKENFDDRRKELLDEKNPTKLKHISDDFKFNISHSLLDYISSFTNKQKKTAKNLRFALSFLLISQIPINKENFEIPQPDTSGRIYLEDDMKLFRKFLNPKRPYKIKA